MDKIITRTQYAEKETEFQVFKFKDGETVEINLNATYHDAMVAGCQAQDAGLDFTQQINQLDENNTIVIMTWA